MQFKQANQLVYFSSEVVKNASFLFVLLMAPPIEWPLAMCGCCECRKCVRSMLLYEIMQKHSTCGSFPDSV